MFDRATCLHEAAHCVVAHALGIDHVAVVRADGSGVVSYPGDVYARLSAEDRAVIAAAGWVGEEVAFAGGNLGRAMRDAQQENARDWALLSAVVRELKNPHAVLDAATRARSILQENRQAWYDLAGKLQVDGIGKIRQANTTPRNVRQAVDLAGARGLDASELRDLATRAQADGRAQMAKLLRASAARAAGEKDKTIEFRTVGS